MPVHERERKIGVNRAGTAIALCPPKRTRILVELLSRRTGEEKAQPPTVLYNIYIYCSLTYSQARDSWCIPGEHETRGLGGGRGLRSLLFAV